MQLNESLCQTQAIVNLMDGNQSMKICAASRSGVWQEHENLSKLLEMFASEQGTTCTYVLTFIANSWTLSPTHTGWVCASTRPEIFNGQFQSVLLST